MSWAMLIEMIAEIVKQRAAAGWPILTRLLERWKAQLIALAEQAGDLTSFGAAPDALKEKILAFLNSLKEKTGPILRIVLSLLIASVPEWIDALWDRLFQQGRVPGLASSYPVVFAAAGDQPHEASALAAAIAELPPETVLDALAA